MASFDIILLVIFLGFVLAGFRFGLVHTLGSIIGIIIGVIVASNFYGNISPFLQLFLLKPEIANWLAFIIIFIIVNRLIGYVVHALDKGFKIFKIIPFISSINRLGGALLGFVEATFTLGMILYMATVFMSGFALVRTIESSAFANLLISIAKILLPLIPAALKYIQ